MVLTAGKYSRKIAGEVVSSEPKTAILGQENLKRIEEQTRAIQLNLKNAELDVKIQKEIQMLDTILTNIEELKRLEKYIKARKRILTKCMDSLMTEKQEVYTLNQVSPPESLPDAVASFEEVVNSNLNDFRA